MMQDSILPRGRAALSLALAVVLGVVAGDAAASGPWSKGQLKARLHADVSVQPHGSFVRRFQAVQADKAEASDFVIFLNEWFEGGATLGPYGMYHVNQIAQRLPAVPFPVKVQPQADPSINETRRQVIVQALLNLGVTDAETRVVIAYPEAEELRYEDIEYVYTNSKLYPQTLNPYSSGFYGGGYRGGFGGRFFGGGYSPFGYGGARPIIFGY